jgi:hypothetical protein
MDRHGWPAGTSGALIGGDLHAADNRHAEALLPGRVRHRHLRRARLYQPRKRFLTLLAAVGLAQQPDAQKNTPTLL